MPNLTTSILVMSGIIGLAMTITLMTVARAYPKKIKGIYEWAYSTSLASFVMLLMLLRIYIPNVAISLISNGMILLALMQLNVASRLLVDKKPWLGKDKFFAILSAFTLLYLVVGYIDPSGQARLLLLGAFLIPIVIEQIVFTLRNFEKSLGKNLMLASLGLIVIGSFFRAVASLSMGDILNANELFSHSDSPLTLISLFIPALTLPISTVSCIMIASEKLRRSLEHAASHDDLTGTLNKKAVTEVLEQEIKRAKRQESPLSIMLLDLDDFKKINDLHGHIEGDKVLTNFARKSKLLLRETDYLSRFGGDEFMAVLPNASTEQTLQIAERINQAGRESNPPWSVSIGIAAFSDNDNYESILTRADSALYEAKSYGKNKAQIKLS